MNDFADQGIPQISTALDFDSLLWILDHIFGNVFVTDGSGQILFVNQQSARVLKRTREQLLHKHASLNIQENGGVMSRSTTLESIKTKRTVMGGFTTTDGVEYFSTSTPMFDESGKVQLVLTYSQEKKAMDKLSEAVEREHRNAENYRHALKYMRSFYNSVEPVFESPKMKDLIKIAEQVAKLDSTVFISGESGTGKEVLANYIQLNSNRRDEPFIRVNCAAIPTNLMESEFFGYAKGAFTGADRDGKPGLLEIANHGVLLLDEVGELPMELQGKLLRVLETSEFYRIGGTKLIQTDIRLITATNQDLRQRVKERLFREDLFYRLNVIPLSIPPLRERHEDIEPLARSFLNACNQKYDLHREFSPEVIKILQQHSWPGNVRELRNTVERMALMSTADVITPENVMDNPILSENLGLRSDAAENVAPAQTPARRPRLENLPSGETTARQYTMLQNQKVLEAMLATNGNKIQAAKLLGISTGKLYRLLNKTVQ